MEVVCLGILINTIHKTISIPPEKLQEIKNICSEWQYKKSCTKTQLQSLLGSLLYVTKCVRPARFFLNRMLQILRDNTHLDASLTGFGAKFGPMVYALPLGDHFTDLHITQLEMLNIIVAIKVWVNLWENKKVEIKCDNLAVVEDQGQLSGTLCQECVVIDCHV